MVSCVHHIPGRARFKIEALRRDAELAAMIEQQIRSLNGVRSIEINRHAASIIVHYCPETGEIGCIMDHICAHCPKAALNRRACANLPAIATEEGRDTTASDRRPSITHAMGQAVSKAVLNTFINHTIDRGLSSILTRTR